MPIDVKCQCGRKASVPDSLAGKKGEMPGCGEVMEVPGPVPTSASIPEPGAASDTIELQCPACSRKFRVSDVAAGKKWRCRCGEMVDVPSRGGLKAPKPLMVETDEEDIALVDSYNVIKTEENFVPLVPDMSAPSQKQPRPDEFGLQRVVVVNFDMEFKTLVFFIIKVTLASIPAMIMLSVITFVLMLVLSMVTFLFGFLFGSFTNSSAPCQTVNQSIDDWQPSPVTKTIPNRKPKR